MSTDDADHDDTDDKGVLRRAAHAAAAAATSAAGYVADKRFDRTPAGKARKAAEDGATTFHIRLDLDDIAYRSGGRSTTDPRVDDAIGQIEAEGWHLDNLEYVTETDAWETTDDEGVAHGESSQRTSAVMLFRRAHG